ncbi:unnamed protein product [Diatraea saccharalis]|uniref:Serum response factor-binding protein 1 n=1 Tax=Diatraea saccharalis TaxID=40085 RepID=A0A9N9R7H8_9NEOP|nr:unnamed protein product [Diatraea saccharalis]
MEVGAVKQAFNNELILLKKKLNQAKIQIIHKLTRKAKTLAERKAPEVIKEKLKRKADAAVNEVLIIKKIKPKDLARFAVTHKGQLNDHLNKPNVDQDKACARLLLHKALQDKYKLMRNLYSNIAIDDLLMSREERRKLKKEEKEKQKNKKKGTGNKPDDVVNTVGVWEVDSMKDQNDGEQSDMEEDKSEVEEEATESDKDNSVQENDDNSFSESEVDSYRNEDDENADIASAVSENESDYEKDDEVIREINTSKVKEFNLNSSENSKVQIKSHENDKNAALIASNVSENESEYKKVNEAKRPTLISDSKKIKLSSSDNSKIHDIVSVTNLNISPNNVKKPKNNLGIKCKEKSKPNKNRNLNEKLLSRKFKKDSFDAPIEETKVVDPFFVTSTGENYLSVVEPRAPDEVKEIHRQGNRKLRRAAMFGRVPKMKPRRNNFEVDENRFNRFNKHSSSYNNDTNKYANRGDFSNDKRDLTSKRSKLSTNEPVESKPERLHPSWEAKKRQSKIQPFQGKKIVFDES